MIKSSVALALLMLLAAPVAAETISGRACYRFARGESLDSARATALSLAKRRALEAYRVFSDAIGAVQDPALREDFVLGLADDVLHNVRVTNEVLRFDRREVCSAITASVDAEEMIDRVVARMNASGSARLTAYSRFPGNDLARVLEAIAFKRGGAARVVFVFRCKRRQARYRDAQHRLREERFRLRLAWVNRMGMPGATPVVAGVCAAPGAVGSLDLPLPPWNQYYWINLQDPAPGFSAWVDR